MQQEIEDLKPIFEANNLLIDLPAVKERLEEKELLKIIDKYDGMICGDDRITKKVINKARNLKVIVKWGTGIDSIDKKYAEKNNIPVFNTLEAFTKPVADTVMGFILAFARNLREQDDLVKNGKWQKIKGFSLSEKTLGIIGVGSTGQAVAKRAQSFGMKILGNDIKKISDNVTKKYNIKMVSKEKLLSEADIISLHCDLNKTSYYLISGKEFEIMKNKAIIINTARGPIISELDLIKALKNKKIAGAGLDVYENEPLSKNNPLRGFENVILSCHNSNSSPSCWQKVHENSIKMLFEGLRIIKTN